MSAWSGVVMTSLAYGVPCLTRMADLEGSRGERGLAGVIHDTPVRFVPVLTSGHQPTQRPGRLGILLRVRDQRLSQFFRPHAQLHLLTRQHYSAHLVADLGDRGPALDAERHHPVPQPNRDLGHLAGPTMHPI